MMYYQLWHERTHASASAKWLRERVKAVARRSKMIALTLVRQGPTLKTL